MKTPSTGDIIDGFEILERIHSGAMAYVYRVTSTAANKPDFPIVMKVPRMSLHDGAETIVSFEVESQIMPVLTGTHVPRFVAAGNLTSSPYLVMEYIEGKTLQQTLDSGEALTPEKIAELGAAVAHAVHSLHMQNICHLDLKPANVLIRHDGTAVLLDFGLSYHAHFPDLLAEEMRKAIGSPAWIAPEQVVGVRGDPRSDIFAIGVMLYELATAELPFGSPQSSNGLRNRLWMDPVPPRKIRNQVPAWLQEVILRCLEPEAEKRYPSAAHLALDLSNTDQIVVTERGTRLTGTGFKTHFLRWLKAAGMHYKPSPLPTQQIESVPIIMVAVPHKDVSDATLVSLREAVARSLGIRPGARLTCVTVISPRGTSLKNELKSEPALHRRYLSQLQQWARSLDLTGHQVSYHVLESTDVASALVLYAESNHVSMIIMGAATHGLKLQNILATVPIKVAMRAPCTLILVKQSLNPENIKKELSAQETP
jgi:serine/threonine protein kinase